MTRAHLPSGSAFAVVCRWSDRRRVPYLTGHEAVVVTAANANEALLLAHAARPDLWETPAAGFYRETAVHPAHIIEGGD
jgi:hypothetical protein